MLISFDEKFKFQIIPIIPKIKFKILIIPNPNGEDFVEVI